MRAIRAKARRHVPGQMNRLEADWAACLELEKRAGKIHDYRFEAIRLVLADRTTYTPDFWVVEADGTIRIDETKGFLREEANVKLKVAARLFPWFTFRLIRKGPKNSWDVREVSA